MIGNKLKELRTEKGYTIVQLCKELEMNSNTYAKYERNERDVSTDTLSQLADFYDVSTDYLLGRTSVKQMTKEPDLLTELTQLFQLSEIERLLVQTYITVGQKEREKLIEVMEEVVKQKEETQQAPEALIIQQPPPTDIQISKMSSEFAIARGGNGMYKPLPTDEQMESFEEVTPDMI